MLNKLNSTTSEKVGVVKTTVRVSIIININSYYVSYVYIYMILETKVS
jgi:hypothetical protein